MVLPGKPPSTIADDDDPLPHQPDRLLPDRRPARRLRPDGPQDHRRHLRRPRPARRRRLQRQGPDQGRSLGRLHGPLHRQEHRRRRPGRRSAKCSSPTPSATPTRSTSGSTPTAPPATGLTDEQLVDLIRKHFKLTPQGHHRDAEPAPADLPRNGPPRPLRPRTAELHLGKNGQGQRPAEGSGPGGPGRLIRVALLGSDMDRNNGRCRLPSR